MGRTTFALDAGLPAFGGYEDTTPQDIRETIETNLWLAEKYHAIGAFHLRDECINAAWYEWQRFEPLLTVYAGSALGEKVKSRMDEWGVQS